MVGLGRPATLRDFPQCSSLSQPINQETDCQHQKEASPYFFRCWQLRCYDSQEYEAGYNDRKGPLNNSRGSHPAAIPGGTHRHTEASWWRDSLRPDSGAGLVFVVTSIPMVSPPKKQKAKKSHTAQDKVNPEQLPLLFGHPAYRKENCIR
jgi:hypothetical protein